MRRLSTLLAMAAGGALVSGAAWAQAPGHADPHGQAPGPTSTTPDQGAMPDQQAPPAAPDRSNASANDASRSGQDTSATSGAASGAQPPRHKHKSYDYGRTDDGAMGARTPSNDTAAAADEPGGGAPPRSQ